MKTTKHLSILTLAVIGALYGASPAWATPLLNTYVGVWSSGGAHAIPGILSLPGVAAGGWVHAGTPIALADIPVDTRARDYCGRALTDTDPLRLPMDRSGLCPGELARSAALNGGPDVVTVPGGSTQVGVLPYAPAVIPEPATLALLGLGLAGLGLIRRRLG